MALMVTCSKGHTYIQADIYENWPADWPYCPDCLALKTRNEDFENRIKNLSDKEKIALIESLLDSMKPLTNKK